MQETTQTASLPLIVSILRRNRLVIVGTIVLAVAAALFLAATSSPVYESTAVVAFNDESADLQALGTPAAPSFQPDKLAAAQAERITRPDVIARVRDKLRLKATDTQLQDKVSTTVEPSSNLVAVKAKGSSAKSAAELANAFAGAVRDDTNERQRARYRAAGQNAQQSGLRLKGTANATRRGVFEDQASRLFALATFARPVDIVRTAEEPTTPSSPKPVRNSIVAGLLGLIFGIGIAFLRHTFDRRMREPADVEGYLEFPTVGLLDTDALGQTLVSKNGSTPMGGDEIEPFRIIRVNVGFLSVDQELRTLIVTSPLPEEGKSTVAAGLAWAESMTGKRTLVVDCDMRRPSLASRLGLETKPGLSDFLLGDASPSDILRVVHTTGEGSQFVCIPAGRPVANHAELLESDRFADLLRETAKVYDRVILDTPPLLPVSDTLSLLPQVDGLLLCVRLGQTTRDEALAAKAALEYLPKKPIGLVLTGADEAESPYYVGSYDYSGTAS
jgi:succinoglycan biosynthesis transport protein ExoP